MADLVVAAKMTGDASSLVGAAKQSADAITRVDAAAKGVTATTRTTASGLDDLGNRFLQNSNSADFFDRKLQQVGTRLLSVRNLFGPLLATFSLGSLVSFGENIAQNFETIIGKARELGIAVDDNLQSKLEDASKRSSVAWTRLSLDVAPYVAAVENAISATIEFANKQRELGAMQIVDPETGLVMSTGKAAPKPDYPWDTQGNVNFAGSNASREQRLKEQQDALGDQQLFTQEQARQQLAINNANANANAANAEQILKERKDTLDAANDQDLANTIQGQDDMKAAWEKYYEDQTAALTQFHNDEDNAWSKYYEEQARKTDQFNDQIAQGLTQEVLNLGDIFQQSGGKIGKAIGQIIIDMGELILKLQLTKALTDSNVGGGVTSFLGKLGGSLGITTGESNGIPSGGGTFGGFFGNLFGSGGGVDTQALSVAGLAHAGGVPGAGEWSGSRVVSAGLFANAPRFHGGEIPAIIRDDESVLTPAQMRTLGGAGRAAPNVTINISTPQGTAAKVNQRRDANGDLNFDVMVDQVEGAIANRMVKGTSKVGATSEAVYGLSRKVR